MVAYATEDDVYLLALTAQAFVVRGRPFDAVDASTATVRLKAHGLAADDGITFEKVSGGTLPTGITEFAVYYPVIVGTNLFRVATTPGGSPISSWVSAGGGWTVSIEPSRRIAIHLEEAAARINECLTANNPPLEPDASTGLYPMIVRGLNARMAARSAVTSLQIENAQYRVAIDRLMAMAAFDGDTNPPAQKGSLLGDWKAGKPINPRPVDQDTLANNSARAGQDFAPTEWRSGVL